MHFEMVHLNTQQQEKSSCARYVMVMKPFFAWNLPLLKRAKLTNRRFQYTIWGAKKYLCMSYESILFIRSYRFKNS